MYASSFPIIIYLFFCAFPINSPRKKLFFLLIYYFNVIICENKEIWKKEKKNYDPQNLYFSI